jgi:hypothetical protein
MVVANKLPVNTTINEVTKRHQYDRTKLDAPMLDQYLSDFQKWLGSPNSSVAANKVGVLSPSSIYSYTSNVRRFFVWLHVSCVFVVLFCFCSTFTHLFDYQQSTGQDGEKAITAIVEGYLLLQDYVVALKEARYVLKTQLNHLLALQKLFSWIGYCIAGKCKWPSLYQRRNIKSLLSDRNEWFEKQIKVVKPDATRESIERNDRISLEESNRWIDLSELIKVPLFICLFITCCVLIVFFSRSVGEEPSGEGRWSFRKDKAK